METAAQFDKVYSETEGAKNQFPESTEQGKLKEKQASAALHTQMLCVDV